MARDWSEERWIKVFLVDSPRWLALSWQARGLYVLLQRLCDRDGYVDLGPDSTAALSAILRAPEDEIRGPLRELHRSGMVVECGQALELPEHRDQQASRASGAARQRQYRQRVTRSDEGVTRSDDARTRSDADKPPGDAAVTRSDDQNRIDQNIREKREQNARAREAARTSTHVEVDPKAVAIEVALRGSSRFAALNHQTVAEALLGALGPLGMRLTPEHAQSAVSLAALELEDGANERRMRQVLGWKLKDAVDPTKANKHPVQVQGQGEDLDRFLDNLNNGRPAWA